PFPSRDCILLNSLETCLFIDAGLACWTNSPSDAILETPITSTSRICQLAHNGFGCPSGYLISMKSRLALSMALILVTPLCAFAAAHTKGRAVQPFTSEFKPGDYVWHPEASPAGPVVIIVSLPEQRMYIYRNGVRIGQSTVSTGTQGHATPT